MGLFRSEAPLLSPNAAIDEGLGIETSIGSKAIGSFAIMSPMTLGTNVITNSAIYIAPYPVEVVAVNIAFGVNSVSGNVMLEKTPGTTAVGSGNNLLTAVISTAGANNTVTAGTLVTTASFLQLAKGDRLSIITGNNQNGLSGQQMEVQLKRI